MLLEEITWSHDFCFEFDTEFRVVTHVDAEARQTEFTLDERGLATTMRRAFQGSPETTLKTVFDSEGKSVTKQVAFRNDGDASDTTVTTRTLYDVFDRVEYVKDTDSDSTANYKRLYYDLASMVTEVEEFNSSSTLLRQTKSYYDELDRLWKTTRGTSEEDVTTFEYDKASRRTKTTDDNSNATVTEYDIAGRVTKTLTPSLGAPGQNYETLEYDLNGNVTKRTSHEVETYSPYASADFVWEMAYDELNRWTTTTTKGSDGATGPNPVETVNIYDTRNLLIKSTDVDGVPTEHEYDGLMHRTKTTYNIGGADPSPIVVTATYDDKGNVLSRTDDEGNVTTYAYDDQDHLTKETLEDGDWIEYAYNKLGLLMTKRWGNGANVVKTLKYRYDARGLLTTKQVFWTTTPSWSGYDDYKTTEETFTFDGVRRLTNADDNDTKVTFSYDSLDHITSEKLNVNLRSGGVNNWKGDKTTTSTWDDTGKRRTSLTYPISSKKFEDTHDALDRITEIRLDGSPDKPMVRYWYEGPGLDVIRRDRGLDLDAGTANTFRTSFPDDALQRLTEIKHERITTGATTLRDLDYTWGNGSTGRIYERSSYKISDASSTLREKNFVYDKVGRLSKDTWIHPTPDEEYKFTVSDAQFLSKIEKTPAGGSPTTVREFTKATDGSLQMTDYTEPATSFSYDDCGNMIERTPETSGTTYLYYDHENRLVHIDNSFGLDYWFRYDALGRRVVEKAGVTETLFYYDGPHIIEETDSSLSLTRLVLFGIQLDELLYSGDTDGSANLTDHHWPLTDHLGSVLRVLDNSAGLLADFDYTSAYGEATVTGTESSYPYGFAGRRRILGALPLYDYRTRVYEPGCGRFLQRDSIGIWEDDANLGNGYTGFADDPVNTVDPTGKRGESCASLDVTTPPIEGMAPSTGKAPWEDAQADATANANEWCIDRCNTVGYCIPARWCTSSEAKPIGKWSYSWVLRQVPHGFKQYTVASNTFRCYCYCELRKIVEIGLVLVKVAALIWVALAVVQPDSLRQSQAPSGSPVLSAGSAVNASSQIQLVPGMGGSSLMPRTSGTAFL